MARFSCLALAGQLTVLPKNYGQRLPLFYGNLEIIAHHHIDKLVDFIDLEGVDDEEVKIRIIAQSFSEEVKKWFRGLEYSSIKNSRHLTELFLD